MILKIVRENNRVVFEKTAPLLLDVCYEGEYLNGDIIQIETDSNSFLSICLDPTLKESIIYLPNGIFKYRIPFGRERSAAYAKEAFDGTVHRMRVRTAEDEEVFGKRLISLNSHDLRQSTGGYPHVSATAVTRNDPCFYERNAIDGIIRNESHGDYPYHSWAAGAREDIEYYIDFGASVCVNSVRFFLRADFPHDTYWKSLTLCFDDGSKLPVELIKSAEGQRVLCQGIVTRMIVLKEFKQAANPLSWAALSQIEVYGNYINKKENMEIRYPSSPIDYKTYDTKRLREEYHIGSLFTKDNIRMVYSHFDRLLIAGLMPVAQKLSLDGGKELASSYFLERREMGCINIGGEGKITADGVSYSLAYGDGIYIGMGTKELQFESANPLEPAKFYVVSCPAHVTYPTVLIKEQSARHNQLGTSEDCNKRVLTQYLHPAVLKTCQLSMGLTRLAPGSNWNTMPSHTHERRMEAYLYFELGTNDVVFHMMGPANETRHIVMRNEEAVISPSWSIHSGVGTKAYAFIWAMCGENQDFDDMDAVETTALR